MPVSREIHFAHDSARTSDQLKAFIDSIPKRESELPDLSSGHEKFSSFLDKISEFFSRYFNLDKKNQATDFQWLNFGLAFVLSIVLLWVIFKAIQYFVNRKGQTRSPLSHQDSQATYPKPLEQLFLLLEEKVRQKEWAQALRLRWQILLFKKNLPLNTTPREFFGSSGQESFEINSFMFSELTHPESQDFDRYDQRFLQLEEPS